MIDQMTGERATEAKLATSANAGKGEFEVTAICNAPDLLKLEILYFSCDGRDIGYLWKPGRGGLLNGGLEPSVYMRVQIDGGNPANVDSQSDLKHLAIAYFINDSVGHAFSDMNKNVRQNPGLGALGAAMNSMARMGVAAGASGTADAAFTAHLIRIELPLSNGEAPILEIRPQDPQFRKLGSMCGHQVSPSQGKVASPAPTPYGYDPRLSVIKTGAVMP